MAVKQDILDIYAKEVEGIKEAGLFKGEAPIVSPQGARVKLEDGREVINMCANNYLGLGDDKRLIEAAKKTYDEKGYGLASVRFIAEPRIFTNSWKNGFHPSSEWMTRSFTLPVLMPMAVCLRPSSPLRMLSSVTN